MYPRLLLAKDLLRDDGVIFISIDDNEQANLKLLCDDVFGEQNCLAQLPTIMNLKGNQDEFGFAGTHEYTLVYAKRKENAQLYEFPLEEDDMGDWDSDAYGAYKQGANLKATGVNAPRAKRPNLWFPIFIKDEEWSLEFFEGSEEVYPMTDGKEMSWRWSKEKFKNEPHNVIISNSGSGVSIYKKQRPSIGDLPSKKPKTLFYKPEYSSGNGTNEIKNLFGAKVFSNPKPVELIADLITISCGCDDLVLDFFSGSATSAQAVMRLNAADNGNRKFIMVQLPEQVENGSDASEQGYETIDQIGMERITRAAEEINELYPDASIDLGFKHFTLVEPPQNTLDKLEVFDPNQMVISDGTVLNDFGKSTILATWLVRDGYGLTRQANELDFAGYKGYYIDKHLYLIDQDLPNEAIEEIVVKYETDGEFNPENVVLFGYSFAWTQMEALKINLKRLRDTEKNLSINFDVRY